MKKPLAVAVLVLWAGVANAAWTVTDNDGWCWMRKAEGGTIVRIDMDSGGLAQAVISSDNINVRNAAGRRTIAFINEGQYSSATHIINYTPDQPGLVFFDVSGSFLNAMARSETMILFDDSPEVLIIGLDGTQSAVQKLRRCAKNTTGGDF